MEATTRSVDGTSASSPFIFSQESTTYRINNRAFLDNFQSSNLTHTYTSNQGRPDASNLQYSYDNAGRLDLVSMPGGNVDYVYYPNTTCVGCAAGRLMSVTGPSAENVDYTYDGPLTSSVNWSGEVNGSVSFGYDTDFRAIRETVTAGSTTSTAFLGYDGDSLPTCLSRTACKPSPVAALGAQYNSAGQLTSVTLGNVTEAYTYNSFGELATHTATTGSTQLFRAVYDVTNATRDAMGRIRVKSVTIGGTTQKSEYSYDSRGRLEGVAINGTATRTYGYDGNGNRLSVVSSGTTVAGTYDAHDRLLTYGTSTYTYGANGELESKTDAGSSGSTLYTYDVRGSLRSVALPNGDVLDYVIDGQSRRVGKKVNGALTQAFLYKDQLRIAAELTSAGTIAAQFTYLGQNHSPDYMSKGGVLYRLVKDQVGSVRLVVNTSTGAITQAIDYDEFGRVLSDSNPGFQPFGFAGGLYDTATGLVRFGARDYDAVTGRWMSKDPIRWDGGEPNLYGYVYRDPINLKDRSGTAVYECKSWGNGPYSIIRHTYQCVIPSFGARPVCFGWGGDPYNPFSNNCYQWAERTQAKCRDRCR